MHQRTNRRAVRLGAAVMFTVSLGGPLVLPGTITGPPVPTMTGMDPPVAPLPAAAPAVPLDGELYPLAITTEQRRFTPTPEQMTNARSIVDTGRSLGLPPRAWVIAIGTALQESNLNNLGYLGARNDHDSLGLFQQRPSAGWGTPEQVTDPTYAATAFYNRLSRIHDWPTLPLTVAAQKVQISAYPSYYAKHESQAGDIVRGLYGEGPFAGIVT